MFTCNQDIIEEIKQISQGTEQERLLRLELGQQEIKKRLAKLEQKKWENDE